MSSLRRALSQGPRPVDELLFQLGISQATFSRTIHQMDGEAIAIREPGIRTPRYALLRAEPVASPQPMFRIDAEGRVEEVGKLSLLQGGGTWVDLGGKNRQLHQGLPPAMAFAAPSGYLGARLAKLAAASIGVPPSLRDWSDDHRVKFLCSLGSDVAGSLMWGANSFAAHMDSRRLAPWPDAGIPRLYQESASATARVGIGSSAGGEQPKFTCETESRGHLIVKFARAGSRSADLLVLEELALSSLAAVGIAAAAARYLEIGDYGFLEVDRFDRIGRFGRRGMISAGAIDDEFFGQRDNWPAFARRAADAGMLDEADVQRVGVLTSFSELIGNDDRHFENLSLMTDEQGRPSAVSPAYDMLPTIYSPLGGGIEPELRLVSPAFNSLGAQTGVWTEAFEAAHAFWTRAAADKRLSAPMREISAENATTIAKVVAPLLPASRP